MNKAFALLCASVWIVKVQAQVPGQSTAPPQVITEILQHGERIVPREEVTPKQREFLWKGKTLDRSGIIWVENTPEYIQLPEAFFRHPAVKKVNDPNFVKNARKSEFVLVGTLDEGDERLNYIYKTAGQIVVLTVWPYQRHGVKTTRFEEMLNQSVSGVPATLTLSRAAGMKMALWKLGWKKEGKSYELYLNDSIDSGGRPEKSPASVIETAEILSRQFE